MQLFRLSSLVVVAALLCTGAAVKCREGVNEESGTYSTKNCSGSCIKVASSYRNTVVWGCLPTRMDDSCISETTVGIHSTLCYCNSDYCNTSAPTSLPSLLLLIPLLVSFLPTHKQLALETKASVSSSCPTLNHVYTDGSLQPDGTAGCAVFSQTSIRRLTAGLAADSVSASSTFSSVHVHKTKAGFTLHVFAVRVYVGVVISDVTVTDRLRANSVSIQHYDAFRQNRYKYRRRGLMVRRHNVVAARLRLRYRPVWQVAGFEDAPHFSSCLLCTTPTVTRWSITACTARRAQYTEHSTQSKVLRAKYTEHSTQSTVHRAQYTEQSTQSTVLRAKYTEHSTQSTVHRAKYTEHSTQSTVHRAQYTEQSTQSTVLRAKYTEHSTQSTVHRAKYTEHSTQSKVHRAQYTGHRAQYTVTVTDLPNRLVVISRHKGI
ncbi:Dynein heavy chain [Chionoecetes opilio]|uniref:Dynein heavy chain n=1 Tax=Chionoecetes opilio TaxID=41210 RepID=A0A8J4XSH9_CHIOP|nr:Dynein heavy chain [Chionoecetes opilio]